jgi:hypothetical protein
MRAVQLFCTQLGLFALKDAILKESFSRTYSKVHISCSFIRPINSTEELSDHQRQFVLTTPTVGLTWLARFYYSTKLAFHSYLHPSCVY